MKKYVLSYVLGLFFSLAQAATEPSLHESKSVDSVPGTMHTRTVTAQKDPGHKLTSPILRIVDGVKGLMDKENVHKVIYVGREIEMFQHGKIDRGTKQRVAQHEYEGSLYFLSDLVKLEEQFEAEFAPLKDKNIHAYHEKMKPMLTLLLKLKDDYLNLTRPFMNDARGTRQQMFVLIKESMTLRKRLDSKLLQWSDEEEEASFRRNITSIKILYQFCDDLRGLFKDLLTSCPRAVKDFNDWMKNQHLQSKP